ncbi:hypothetical protein [Campylobacter sp. MIT 12-5580]|uniref:hypothetical protein n=1 Tax=Campylobacter sp. MIT 12-5580 TaxID=2040651 RepID=UPI002017350C|nr:hypothetical protein [Campylobacter sp. MIT 12-5580]
MKKLLLLCLAVFISFAASLDDKQKQIYQNIAPSDEMGNYEENIKDTYIATSSLVLSAKEYKKQYFVGEVFSLELSAKTTENTEFDFELSFNKNKELVFLNPEAKWQKNGDEYNIKLYFEAQNSNAKLESIEVALSRNKEVFQRSSLLLEPLNFKRVNADKNYSQIVANDLSVKRTRTSYFDDKNLMMIVELRGENANLNDFHLKDETLIEQRIDNVRGDFNSSIAFYSAIFAPNKKSLDFSYFNLNTQKLETLSIAVELSADESVSTQSDLNPKNNDLVFYKQLGLWIVAGLCFVFFIFKRSYIALGIAILVLALSFFIGTDTQTGVVKSGANAKILPTANSTYFRTSKQDEKVEVLAKRQNYIKVLFEDGAIGWIDEKDLQEN